LTVDLPALDCARCEAFVKRWANEKTVVQATTIEVEGGLPEVAYGAKLQMNAYQTGGELRCPDCGRRVQLFEVYPRGGEWVTCVDLARPKD
jgi:hypothetical protein